MIPAACTGTYAIQLAIDNISCGRCSNCQWPRQIPNQSRTACVNRPFAVCTDCRTRQSADRYSCQTCPVGQVQSPTNPQTCYTPVCNGQYAIRTATDSISCGRCATCQWPQQIPNASRTACVNRPLAQCPTCTQRQSDDGYSCQQCPVGQI